MKIIGLDCSTKSTGFCIFNDKELIEYGCITASSTDLIKRINKIMDKLKALLNKHSDVNKIVMEEVIPTTGKNIKTWKALIYLQAELVIFLHNEFPQVQIELIYPNSWRSKIGIQTGRGITREKLKEEDINFVKQKYNISVNDDTADAICIAYSSIFTNFVQ